MRLDEAALAGIRAFFASVGPRDDREQREPGVFPRRRRGARRTRSAPRRGSCSTSKMRRVLLHARRAARDDADDGRAGAAARGGAPVRARRARVVRARLLRTFGMGESTLDAELADIAASGDVVLGFRTSFPDNYLRPIARAATAAQADALLDRVCDAIRARLGPLVYGEGERDARAGGGATACASAARASRWPNRARAVSWRRSSPTCPGRRTTSSAASSPTPTRRSARCSACPRRCSRSTARCRIRWRARWPRACARASARTSRSPPRASRGPAEAARRSRSGSCTSRSRTRRVRTAITSSSPSTARATASSPRRSRSTGSGAALLGVPLEGPTLMRRRGGEHFAQRAEGERRPSGRRARPRRRGRA